MKEHPLAAHRKPLRQDVEGKATFINAKAPDKWHGLRDLTAAEIAEKLPYVPDGAEQLRKLAEEFLDGGTKQGKTEARKIFEALAIYELKQKDANSLALVDPTFLAAVSMEDAQEYAVIARLWNEGKYYWEIAERTGLTQIQVKHKLAELRNFWKQSTLMDFNQRKAEEVAKVDYVEQRNWEIFNEAAARVMDAEGGAEATTAQISLLRMAMENIRWAVERRVRFFGLDKPLEIDWRVEARSAGVNLDDIYAELVGRFAQEMAAVDGDWRDVTDGPSHTGNGNGTDPGQEREDTAQGTV